MQRMKQQKSQNCSRQHPCIDKLIRRRGQHEQQQEGRLPVEGQLPRGRERARRGGDPRDLLRPRGAPCGRRVGCRARRPRQRHAAGRRRVQRVPVGADFGARDAGLQGQRAGAPGIGRGPGSRD